MVDLKLVFIFTIIPFLVCEQIPIPDISKYPPGFLKNGQRGGLGLFSNRTEKAVGRAKGFSSLSEKYPSSFNKNGHRALGIPALKGEVPFQVLLKQDGYFICGGTLISNRFVLTAAHCVVDEDFSEFSIVAGELNRNGDDGTEIKLEVKRVILHPDYFRYKKGQVRDDIALLELEKPAHANGFVQIASLPESETTSGNVKAAGWGRTTGNVYSDKLLIAHLKIVPRSECRKVNDKITSKKICAISKGKELHGICHGDSGGGLIKKDHAGNHIVIGVASYVRLVRGNYGEYPCDLTKPQVFTNVMPYVPWIKNHLNGLI